jgi:hypothetical protein
MKYDQNRGICQILPVAKGFYLEGGEHIVP